MNSRLPKISIFKSTELVTNGEKSTTSPSIWAAGGGKGGIGKSLIVANMGIQLSQVGYRTILIDADLGGANLHTFLGLTNPTQTLGDFISRKAEHINDVVLKTTYPHLNIISGAGDFTGIANIKYTQKLRLLRSIHSLNPYDYILMDLGAGTSYNTLDFFIFADQMFVVVIPEPISIENAYRFIRAAFFRKLRFFANRNKVVELVDRIIRGKEARNINTPLELIHNIENEDPFLKGRLEGEIARTKINLIVNQTRVKDDVKTGYTMTRAIKKYFGIDIHFAGFIEYDHKLWQNMRDDCTITPNYSANKVSRDIRQIIKNIINKDTQGIRDEALQRTKLL